MMRFMTKVMAYLVAVSCFYLPISTGAAEKAVPPENAFDQDTQKMIQAARKGQQYRDESGNDLVQDADARMRDAVEGKYHLSVAETTAARQLLKEDNSLIVRWAANVLLAGDDPVIADDAVEADKRVLGKLDFKLLKNREQTFGLIINHMCLSYLIGKVGANPKVDQQGLVNKIIPLLKKDFEFETGRGFWPLHDAMAHCGEPGLDAVLALMLKQVGKRPTWGDGQLDATKLLDLVEDAQLWKHLLQCCRDKRYAPIKNEMAETLARLYDKSKSKPLEVLTFFAERSTDTAESMETRNSFCALWVARAAENDVFPYAFAGKARTAEVQAMATHRLLELNTAKYLDQILTMKTDAAEIKADAAKNALTIDTAKYLPQIVNRVLDVKAPLAEREALLDAISRTASKLKTHGDVLKALITASDAGGQPINLMRTKGWSVIYRATGEKLPLELVVTGNENDQREEMQPVLDAVISPYKIDDAYQLQKVAYPEYRKLVTPWTSTKKDGGK